MKYRYLGKSGIKVSEISLGSWLTYAGYVNDQNAIGILHAAYDLGINFFDTANVYMKGEAEKVVGKALKSYPRSSYILASKVYFPMGDGPNDRGLSRKHIIEQCHASLKRLQVDYLDIYYCHRFDQNVPVGETLTAIDDLIRQGKVLYAGVSEWTAEQITEALNIADKRLLDRIIVDQPKYNMFYREIEQHILAAAGKNGIGIVAFSPLANGVLTGKYKVDSEPPRGSRATDPDSLPFIDRFLNKENLLKVEKLKDIAAGINLSVTQLALAWTLRHETVSSALIGASHSWQIEENVMASGIDLDPDTLNRIDNILNSQS